MTEVSRVRDIEITWSVMSLAVLNEGKDLPSEYAKMLEIAWGPVRVCIAAREKYGDAVLAPLYTALGTRLHVEGRTDYERIITESIADAGLDASLAAAATDSSFDAALRVSHQRAIDLVGSDVGTPVIALPGSDGAPVAFFGPVITPAPMGDDAARLWDGLALVASTKGFYELKRGRSVGPQFD